MESAALSSLPRKCGDWLQGDGIPSTPYLVSNPIVELPESRISNNIVRRTNAFCLAAFTLRERLIRLTNICHSVA